MESKWCIRITKENKHILLPYWKTLVSKITVKDFQFKGWLLGWNIFMLFYFKTSCR